MYWVMSVSDLGQYGGSTPHIYLEPQTDKLMMSGISMQGDLPLINHRAKCRHEFVDDSKEHVDEC